METLYTSLLENDLNPFILFDSDGKMKDFNKEAEFLFNYVEPKVLFDLALAYASQNYGFNTQYLALHYGKLKFYAVLVGYLDDDLIALRLYKEVYNDENDIKVKKKLEYANIFSIIDLSKATSLLQSEVKITDVYDISIPEVQININDFLLVLNETFTMFKDEEELTLKVYIKTGEYEIINEKKHQIIAIEFITNDVMTQKIDGSLDTKSKHAHINVFKTDYKLSLEFPMIL